MLDCGCHDAFVNALKLAPQCQGVQLQAQAGMRQQLHSGFLDEEKHQFFLHHIIHSQSVCTPLVTQW